MDPLLLLLGAYLVPPAVAIGLACLITRRRNPQPRIYTQFNRPGSHRLTINRTGVATYVKR